MRADRLLRAALLLQARGRMTAADLAAELEVSVRTVYRDLEALSSAGVPVWTQSGPGGGCRLVDGYRMPLSALSTDEASALLMLGTSAPLRDLGLEPSLIAARRRVTDISGVSDVVTVHVDVPRWFSTVEPVPHLPALARAIRDRCQVDLHYHAKRHERRAPLGLVNKAGTWYAVLESARGPYVVRVGQIDSITVRREKIRRPDRFDLVAFWETWSAEFEASRPHFEVTIRASPAAIAEMPGVFGNRVLSALGTSELAEDGWRTLTLTFEHEAAAVGRLAGFGAEVEVLAPATTRDRLAATAQQIIGVYRKPGPNSQA